MSRELSGKCRKCGCRFSGNRKFCSSECRLAAQESRTSDPTPEEIRAMCSRIREEGGESWERTHTCYPRQPVQIRTVTASQYCVVAVTG